MKLEGSEKILVVGLGLMGGSYAKALSDKGFEVGAITLAKEDIDYAREHHMIAHGQTAVTADYVGRFDICVFALYPKQLLAWLGQYQSYFKSGAILTDVTGVKTEVVYPVQSMLRDDLEFIGAHPMAGREVYGVRNARPDMFAGANYIVTPTEKNTEEAISLCESLGEVLGFARISRLSPAEHDEMIGFLSQLTHCIAVSLMTCKDSEHLVDYTGDSFRDLTRIARINENMWSELFLLNKDALLREIDGFSAQLARLREALAEENVDALKQMMRLSTKNRSLFDKTRK